MPRKKRQLLADLRKEGCYQVDVQRKGSQTAWKPPRLLDVTVIIAGHDGDDAKPYDNLNVRKAIADVEKRLS